jgi:DNA-binding MarR family transcriptional regulator
MIVERSSSERVPEAIERDGHASRCLCAAVASTLGLLDCEARVLAHLALDEPLTTSQLGARLGLSSGGATALIQRLEGCGYISRSPAAHDRRSSLLSLAPAARRELEQRHQQLLSSLRRLRYDCPREHCVVIREFLDGVARIAEEAADALLHPKRRRGHDDAESPRLGHWGVATDALSWRTLLGNEMSIHAPAARRDPPRKEHPMKAVGTGAPQLITLRLDDCEVDLYRHALNTWRLALATAIVEERQTDREDWRNREVVACARLTQQLEDANGDPELPGPTDLILRLARDAAREAAHRLLSAIDERCHSDLAALAAAARASAETLAAAHHADAHGLAEGDAVAV